MKKLERVILVVLVLMLVGPPIWRAMQERDPVPTGTPTPAPSGDAWINLLDADRQGAWKNITDEKEIFEIEGGELHIFGRTLYPLRYVAYEAERLKNFELHLEVKVVGGANSGVFLRAQPNDPVYRGFEVQVLDDHGKPPSKNGTGGIYDVVTPMFNMALPAGEWNSYDIVVDGSEVRVTVNGWLVVHADLSKMTMPIGKFEAPFADLPEEGLLMFQDHGGEVWYRNVFLKKLP